MDSFILINKKPEDEREGPTWIDDMDIYCRKIYYSHFVGSHDGEFCCIRTYSWNFDKRWCKILKVVKRL